MRRKTSNEALATTTGATTEHEHQAHEVRTPTLISPPESKTPPTINRNLLAPTNDNLAGASTNGRLRSSTTTDKERAVDAQALSRALEKFDDAAREKQRERDLTPGMSPSRKRVRTGGYGDRYVHLDC